MSRTLNGQQVVITGGSGFLGSAVVKAFLDSGARCHVTWLMEDELKRFSWRDQVVLHRVDCADERQVTAFYSSLDSLFASIQLVGGFAMQPIEQTSAEEFRRMYELNTLTSFLCNREAVRAIRRSGQGGGRIVNVAARPALAPAGGMIAYTTSKAAVASLTQCLAEELKQEGILVNAVAPSIMDTAANRRSMPSADFSKWPKAEEVAEAIVFLASPSNGLTSGTVLPVYGKA